MKLIYISNNRMPTELAHGLQVAQMCQAFAENGYEVELIVPRRVNPIKDDPFSYYGVKRIFSYTRVPTVDLIPINSRSVFFWIQTITFLFCAKLYLIFKRYNVLYTREQMAGLFFKNIVLEIHALPKRIRPFHLHVWRRACRLVVLTSFIKNKLIEYGVPAEKIMVAPDGVNLTLFDISLSRESAREKIGLPQDKKIIGYVGQLRTLGMEKGIDIALKACAKLHRPDVLFILVGGHRRDIEYYTDMSDTLGIADRVVFTGRVAHGLVPAYLKACDLLLAPFPENEHYSYYMSPMKVFEYMASGRAIISTRLPSLVEALGDSALLIEPGSIDELRQCIVELLDHPERADDLARRARKRVSGYTWHERAKRICAFLP